MQKARPAETATETMAALLSSTLPAAKAPASAAVGIIVGFFLLALLVAFAVAVIRRSRLAVSRHLDHRSIAGDLSANDKSGPDDRPYTCMMNDLL